MIEARSPPDSNSRDRLTVATPSWIDRPSSFVRAGMSEYMAGRALISASLGPRSSCWTAAVATAWVGGSSRSTGARPALSVKLPRKKYARTMVESPDTLGGFGVLVGAAVGSSVGVADGAEDGADDGRRMRWRRSGRGSVRAS